MLRLVVLVREEDVRKVDRAARDIDRLQGVDERLVEALDIVVVRSADNGGEGCLSLREEILGDLGSGHDRVLTVVVSFRWRERRGGSAVVIAGTKQWRAWLRGCGYSVISQHYRSASWVTVKLY